MTIEFDTSIDFEQSWINYWPAVSLISATVQSPVELQSLFHAFQLSIPIQFVIRPVWRAELNE